MTVDQAPWFMWLTFAVCWSLALAILGRRIDPRHPLVPFATGVMVGALLALTLTASVAAEAPRSAQEPAPEASDGVASGFEQVVMATAAPGRSAAPSTSAAPGPSPLPSPATDTRVAPVRVIPDRKPSGITTRPTGKPVVPRGNGTAGRASWYGASGMIAAAGPALRARLGKGWRGQVVTVCAGERCIRVRLADWCQCYRGEGRERLIDLSDDAFRRLAPLSRGLVRIRVIP